MRLVKGRIHYSPEEARIMQAIGATNGVCGNIDIGSTYNCDFPINAGTDNRLILMDKEVFDLAIVTFDVTIVTLITNIVLTGTGNAAFSFQGIRRSTRPQSAFVPQTVSVGYNHQVEFQIFNIGQVDKDNIEKMALSRMVAVVQNSNSEGNGDAVFEVFGKDVGMEVQGGPMRINTDLETNGSYTINLMSSDDSGKEPKLPTSMFAVTFAATKVIVDALLVPVV